MRILKNTTTPAGYFPVEVKCAWCHSIVEVEWEDVHINCTLQDGQIVVTTRRFGPNSAGGMWSDLIWKCGACGQHNELPSCNGFPSGWHGKWSYLKEHELTGKQNYDWVDGEVVMKDGTQ